MPIGQLVDGAWRMIKGGPKQPKQAPLTHEQRMAALPMRNPGLEWKSVEDDETPEEDWEVVVVLPRRKDRVGKLLNWMFVVPEKKPLTLDRVGSFVWKHCDGTHTFGQLVDMMARKYQVSKREMEVSLAQFLHTLGKRGMVTAIVPQEVVEQLDESQRKAMGITRLEAAPEPEAAQEAPEGERSQEKDKSTPPPGVQDMPKAEPSYVFSLGLGKRK